MTSQVSKLESKNTSFLVYWEVKMVCYENYANLYFVLLRKVFMEKCAENAHQKLLPNHYLILVKTANTTNVFK